MVFNAGIIIWLVVISALLIRMISHYNRLTRGISKRGLQEILEAIVAELGSIKRKTYDADRVLQTLVAQGEKHFQKIGVVRFNPFADTGGAQSFTIALLDMKGSGIIMTSLYGRSSNRWYVKEVRLGKGNNVELSKEEVAAIEQANKTI